MTDKTCKERINDEYADRIETIESIFDRIDDANNDEDYDAVDKAETELDEYGISFDYVEPNTFEDQERGYIRWELSWGGPSDEFRFFIDQHGGITDIEYRFMDWFDGAVIEVNTFGNHAELLDRAFDWFTGGCPLHLIKDYQEAI
ncbi:MAG: hypothetical protein ACR2ON_07680 [Paracoccaceae bacterium]